MLIQVPFFRSFDATSSCIAFYISVAYSLPLLPATSLTLAVSSRVPLRMRVIGCATIQACAVLLLLFYDYMGGTGYLLAVVVVISVTTVVMQSSLYGYMSLFSPDFARTLFIGQGCTGLISSAVQIFTQYVKAVSTADDDDALAGPSPSDWAAAIACSCAGAAIILAGASGFYWLNETNAGREAMRTCEADTVEVLDSPEASPPASPVSPLARLSMSPSNSSTTLHSLIAGSDAVEFAASDGEGVTLLLHKSASASSFDESLKLSTMGIFRSSWVLFTTLLLTLVLTMLIFPGLLLGLQYEGAFGPLSDPSWWPIILLAIYNAGDCTGRFSPHFVQIYVGDRFAFLKADEKTWDVIFLGLSVARFVLIPLLKLIFNDGLAVVCAAALGFSNGWLQLEALVEIPRRTASIHAERVGTLVSAIINVGIVGGSVAALGLSPPACLSPQ